MKQGLLRDVMTTREIQLKFVFDWNQTNDAMMNF
jgi:hypothetical protein